MWEALILALLRLVAMLMGQVPTEGSAAAEIALQLAKILAMTAEGKRMLHGIEGMTDAELDDWLKELGRRSPRAGSPPAT